jgi:hypothetical protein
MSLESLHSVTSSPGLGFGVTPSEVQDGQITAQYGPEAAPANLSPRRAKELGLLTSGTYSPRGSISSSSAVLSRSLVSRLKQVSDRDGSTLFKLTWKESVTPSGRSVSLLRASVLRTNDSDCSSWLTPSANEDAAGNPGAKMQAMLGSQAKLAVWATPNTMDYLPLRSMEALRKQFSTTRKGRTAPANLREQVHPECYPANVFGATTSSSPALMEKSGQLNPAHSRWLMGLPTAWDDCAVMVTPLSRRSRKRSSKPTSTRRNHVNN